MNHDPKRPDRPHVLLTFQDLTQDLVWPRLLRAGVLAFHPARLFLSLLLLAVVALVIWSVSWLEASLGWTGVLAPHDELPRLLDRLTPGGPTSAAIAGERLVDLFLAFPLLMLKVHPLVTLIGLPVCIILTLLVVAAIVRSAATEFAADRAESLPHTLRFARTRLTSLLAAILGPVLIVWGVAFLLALAGLLLARLAGLNLIAAVLYILALLAGAFAAFLMLVYALGKPLLIPAVCCDGADAIDAIQRAYSYVLAKPLRLALYSLILAAQGVVLLLILTAFCAAVVSFTQRTTSAWAGDRGDRMLHASRIVAVPAPTSDDIATPELSTSDRLFNAGASIIRTWNIIPAAIPLAFLLSYAACATTLLYLGMRRICDGQDMNELWSPEEDRPHALGADADHSLADAAPDSE